MGRQHQIVPLRRRMCEFSPLVVVASVGADEVTGIVDNDRTPVTVEPVNSQIGTDVDGIAQDLRKARAHPWLPVFQHPVGLQTAGDIAAGALRLCVQLIDQPYLLCLLFVDSVHRGSDAVDGRGAQTEAVWHPAAHIETFLAAGVVGVRHALLDRLPLQLGEYDADIQHGAPHGR